MSSMMTNSIKLMKYLQTKRTSSKFIGSFNYWQRNFTSYQRQNIPKTHWRTCTSLQSHRCSSSQPILVESPYPATELPNQNLVDFIYEDMDEEIMERTALTCGSTGRAYNYGTVRMLTNRFAQAVLSHCQMKPREVIGLLLPNIPEYAVVCHGAMEAGLPVTFVNPLYTANEIRRQFQNAEVKLIATVPQLLDVAMEVGSTLVGYRGTICVGGEDDLGKRVFGLKSLLSQGYEAELPGISPKEVAIVPYSSGTTGMPKGVMLSHHNLVSNLVQIEHPDIKLRIDPGEVLDVFTVLPFFHIYGFNTILNSTLKLKMHMITLPRFNPEEYIKCLVAYKPKVLFVVPSLITFLTENSNVMKDHLKSVRDIKSGAAHLPEGMLQRFKQKFGDQISVKQGYGMTECSPVAITTPNSVPPNKQNTIGILVPNTQAKILDLTTGDSLGENKPGELVIKGPQVMMGYLNNEKATRETIDEEGWLHTGDVAYYDSDKYFFVIDRCKELIKVKGNQVSPTELENLLLEIPDVADVAVVGIPDALADEVPRAFVVRKPGSEISDKEILKYVNARVVHYKKLVGGIVFLDIIPRNPSGKILRNELKINESKYIKSQA